MSLSKRFFNYLFSLNRNGSALLSEESCLYLFASTIALKPMNILNIGVGPGDVALILLMATKSYTGGKLTCLIPTANQVDADPQVMKQLRQDGVNLVRCATLDNMDSKIRACHFDLIAVDLCNIDTSADFATIIAIGNSTAHIFLYTSQATQRIALLTEAASRFSPPQWTTDVISCDKEPDRPPLPDMLSIRTATGGGARHGLQDNVPSKKTGLQSPGETIYLALPPPANNFGWGLCSRYLSVELGKIHRIHVLEKAEANSLNGVLPGKVFHALTSIRFESIFEHARGEENYAYTFFENELLPESVENAKHYDLVLGGSTWCMEQMRAKGISNSGVLIQGVDPRYFHPINTPKPQDKFVLFSGGKFELRKGQDLVLAAFKALQDKYPDLVLVNCWHNLWQQSMDLMVDSKLIRYERKGESWAEVMNHIYALNGIDPTRVFTIDLVPNETQRDLYSKTDIGIFPNRCEGGTNLVLMEYMACAKPVIGAYSTGQKDVLSTENALLLKDIRPYEVRRPDKSLVARWTEPCLEELIAQIEFAYNNRDRVGALGRRAGEDLKQLTWTHTAKSLLRTMGEE